MASFGEGTTLDLIFDPESGKRRKPRAGVYSLFGKSRHGKD